jgi:hypothetical protein
MTPGWRGGLHPPLIILLGYNLSNFSPTKVIFYLLGLELPVSSGMCLGVPYHGHGLRGWSIQGWEDRIGIGELMCLTLRLYLSYGLTTVLSFMFTMERHTGCWTSITTFVPILRYEQERVSEARERMSTLSC